MKHHHNADLNVRIDIPTQDLEDLIDKTTDAVLVIIIASTVGHILRKLVK